ncbi:MAG: MFS transporter [Pseudomonadota bacterium]
MSTTRRWAILLALILAGEMVFALPFHLPRFFRSTLLDVYDLTNTQLGDAFAFYGAFAMVSYFVGGPIADRFSPRLLLSLSLVLTALGGILMLRLSPGDSLNVVFAYWGVSTILLFWSGLIRATREWGGPLSQGRAFGFLDGGRGLAAAVFASITTALLVQSLGVSYEDATQAERLSSFSNVIYFYSGITFATAILVWLVLPNSEVLGRRSSTLTSVITVVSKPVVWLQGLIIVCAYCGYKGLDNYGLYVEQVLGKTNEESNTFMSMTAYTRVVGAIGAGFLADRISASRVISICFLLLLVCYGLLSRFNAETVELSIVLLNLIITFVAVYSLRGVYFALIEQAKIPSHLTGTATGVISVLGFTPDFFFNAVSGRILDASPGLAGFQNYFLLLAGFAFVGLLATLLFSRLVRVSVSTKQT